MEPKRFSGQKFSPFLVKLK